MKLKHTKLYFLLSIILFTCSSESESEPEPILHPGNISLINPINNELCEDGISVSSNSSKVTFNWNLSENTNIYQISIINLDTNQEVESSSLTSTTFEKTLTRGHPYSWRIFSNNNESSQQGSSPTWKFYLSSDGLSNYTPFPAELIYPENEQVFENNTNSVLLNWIGTDIDDEDLIYTVYFDDEDGQQDPQQNLIDISNNEIEVNVESNNTYYWRVKTSDGENSSFSQIYIFYID